MPDCRTIIPWEKEEASQCNCNIQNPHCGDKKFDATNLYLSHKAKGRLEV